MADVLDKILQLMEIGAGIVENQSRMALAREEGNANRKSAQDTLLLSTKIQTMNKEKDDQIKQLKSNIRNQTAEHKIFENQYTQWGFAVDEYGKLNDKDITDSGLDWLEDTDVDSKRRLFQSLSDLETSQMTLEELQQVVKKNNAVIGNLQSGRDEYVGASRYWDDVGESLGFKNMKDMKDVEAWLNQNSEFSEATADVFGKTNEDVLTALELASFNAMVPGKVSEEYSTHQHDIKTTPMMPKGAESAEDVVYLSRMQIEQDAGEKYIPVSLWSKDKAEEAKLQRNLQAKKKEDKSVLVSDLSSSRVRFQNLPSKGRGSDKKYGHFELGEDDLLLSQMKGRTITIHSSDDEILNELDFKAQQIYNLMDKYLESKANYGGSDWISFDDFKDLPTRDKIKMVDNFVAQDLRSTGSGGPSLLTPNMQLKDDIWDFKWVWVAGGIDDDEARTTHQIIESLITDYSKIRDYLSTGLNPVLEPRYSPSTGQQVTFQGITHGT